jgi:hypothetical protein
MGVFLQSDKCSSLEAYVRTGSNFRSISIYNYNTKLGLIWSEIRVNLWVDGPIQFFIKTIILDFYFKNNTSFLFGKKATNFKKKEEGNNFWWNWKF